MKTKDILKYIATIAGVVMLFTACEEEEIGPVLGDSSSFEGPSFESPAEADPVELLPDNATSEFEEFKWTKADYGVQLPVNYTLEMDTSSEFTAPVTLATTAETSAAVTVEDFNDAVLGLGVPGFEQSALNLRVRALVSGGNVDTVQSEAISRTVTTYQLSDCGDFCTVGIIGSATPGGWGTDTDMRLADPERVDKHTWTVTLKLVVGEAKFRAMDDWGTNWGAGGFPSGTGEQDGANIPIAEEGYYKVEFNDQSGDYSFTKLEATEFTTVGIIGDATDGGWDSDTDLTQDPSNPHIWSGEVTLSDGEAKFRANDAWDNNWGAESYPSGYAVGNGPNIPVASGTYFVWFNDATGEYGFMNVNDANPYGTIGVIGTATPEGWDADTDLIQNPGNPYKWSAVMTLEDGEGKFRADDAWDNNWGGSDFPSGIGSKNGPNIQVKGAKYVIFFNSGTGEYTFLK